MNDWRCHYCGLRTLEEDYQNLGMLTIWVCQDPECYAKYQRDVDIADKIEDQMDEDERNSWRS